MATRYYPTLKSPGVIMHGPMQGNWAVMGTSTPYSPVQNRWVLSRTKLPPTSPPDRGALSTFFTTNKQGNYDYATDWTWVTPPLQAQTISGTFNLCFQMAAIWLTGMPSGGASFTDTVARLKLHIYLANGNSVQHKATMLNNYIDPTDIPHSSLDYWTSLTTPATLTPVTVAAGDIIVIEIGVRIVSSRTPVPTYPPSEWSRITFRYLRAKAIYADATPADTFASDKAPWLEFSANILELAPDTTPPANDSCVEAIVIPSVPYTSPFIDSTYSTDINNALWWKFIPDKDGRYNFATHGSNTTVQVWIYTGICGALAGNHVDGDFMTEHRSLAYTTKKDMLAGVTYFIKVEDASKDGGGLVRLSAFAPEAPKPDDLILVSSDMFVLRDDKYINISDGFADYVPSGVAIDYTKRPIVDLRDDTINTKERLYIALHAYELVEAVDLDTLNEREGETEYIGNPWSIPLKNLHPAQIQITSTGMLHTAWFGDGYLYVGGRGASNTAAVFLDAIPSVPAYGSFKSIDATSCDYQPLAPFTDTERLLETPLVAWAFVLDETSGIVYYVTGGLYIPLGGQIIKRYNINTNTQLSDFATIPPSGINPGLKGLELIPTGGLLVCNGDKVHRLNAAGAITQTYVPSIPMDSTTLVDVCLNHDKTKFWVVDLYSTRLFKFDLNTGAELLTFQPYGNSTAVVQMVLYSPPGPPAPLDIGGLYYINPAKATHHDSYYNDVEKKIPNPTIKTGLFGD